MPRRFALLIPLACLLLMREPAFAQNPPGSQEEELRRQLLVERAARKALTYQADMRKAAQLAESEQWSALQPLLEGYRPAAGETDLRGWEWHFLHSLLRKKQLVDREELALQGPNTGIHRLAWSGNGERLAAVGEDGEAVLWESKTGKELRRLGGRVRWVAWDRDGQRLTLSAQNGTVTLWPAEPGPAIRFFGPVEGLADLRQPVFSPDGKLLALAADKTSAAIHDAATGREVRRLTGHNGLVSVLAWHPTGRSLATGSRDGTIRVWETASGNETAILDAYGDVVGLAWRADGGQLAAVVWPPRRTRYVGVWDVARRERVVRVDHPGGNYQPNQRPMPLFLSPDGARVATEDASGLAAWDTSTAQAVFRARTGRQFAHVDGCQPQVGQWATLETVGTRATVRIVDIGTSDDLMRADVEIPMNRYQAALAWSPDGRRVAAGFSQGKVRVFRAPKDLSEARGINTGEATLFAWSPTGRRFAFSTEGETYVGSLPAGGEPPVRLGPPLRLPGAASLSPDGNSLAGADSDGTLPIWDVASGRVARRLAGHPAAVGGRRGPTDRAARALLWSADGKRLASLRPDDGGLRVWDTTTGHVLAAFQFGDNALSIPVGDALPLAWSPDGELLAVRVGSPQPKVRILDVTTGKQTREWDGGPDLGSSNAMAWDPTTKALATCLGNPPRVQIWDVNTGQEKLALSDQVSSLRALSWSPDGRRLAFRLQDRWQIHDLTTRRTTSVVGAAERLAWKPDGSQVAVADNGPSSHGTIAYYDAATGRALRGEQGAARPDPTAPKLPADGGEPANLRLQSLVWNEQGVQAAGYATPYPGVGMLVVWDVRTRQPRLKMGQLYDAPADRARVARMVAWAPAGRSVATLAGDTRADSRIDLWDAATGRKTQTLDGGRVGFRDALALAWSPDGQSLACASESVRVWKLTPPFAPQVVRKAPKAGSEADQVFLAWSADSRSLALLECRHSVGREATLSAWDVSTGRERFSWTRPYELSHLQSPVAWSPDSKRLAWGGPEAGVWNVDLGKEEFALAGHSTPVGDVAWSPDGRRVLSRGEVFGGFTRSFELKVWHSAVGQEIFMLRGPMAGWLVAPGFEGLASPPGRGSDPGDVIVWDLADREG